MDSQVEKALFITVYDVAGELFHRERNSQNIFHWKQSHGDDLVMKAVLGFKHASGHILIQF